MNPTKFQTSLRLAGILSTFIKYQLLQTHVVGIFNNKLRHFTHNHFLSHLFM